MSFWLVVRTPNGVELFDYKRIFIQKSNERNEIVRYKAHLVAQEFSQVSDDDYEETYSPVMDAITFWYLADLVVHEHLVIHMMDMVTIYLYGSLDNKIYMKVHTDFKRLKHIVQNLVKCAQPDYKSHYKA